MKKKKRSAIIHAAFFYAEKFIQFEQTPNLC